MLAMMLVLWMMSARAHHVLSTLRTPVCVTRLSFFFFFLVRLRIYFFIRALHESLLLLSPTVYVRMFFLLPCRIVYDFIITPQFHTEQHFCHANTVECFLEIGSPCMQIKICLNTESEISVKGHRRYVLRISWDPTCSLELGHVGV